MDNVDVRKLKGYKKGANLIIVRDAFLIIGLDELFGMDINTLMSDYVNRIEDLEQLTLEKSDG